MKAPLFSLTLVLLLASGADAQQRRPASSESKAPDCAASQGELPKAWEGQAYAVDGNTLAGVGLKPHLRIWGIQAPELRDSPKADSVHAMRARAALEDLLIKADHKVKCRVAKFDASCRAVAQCSVETIDMGGYMLASGMAYGFSLDETLPWEPRAAERYAGMEFEARKARKGLWPAWLGEP